jgi:DNA repair protein RecO (recombination protein O)
MNSFKSKAIIIKRRNFLEKDRILTLFSENYGKIEALAKGARQPGNRLSANSDLATVANFHIHKTKSIDIISEIEPFFHPDGIRGQFFETQKVSFALKIVDKLFEVEEPHFNTYQSLFTLIKAVSVRDRQLIFLKFLLDVLEDLGSLPNLTNCPLCHKQIGKDDQYFFSFQGGITHSHCLEGECLKIKENEIKLLRILAGTATSKVKNLKVEKKVFQNAYRVILNYFNHEFGKILPDEVM